MKSLRYEIYSYILLAYLEDDPLFWLIRGQKDLSFFLPTMQLNLNVSNRGTHHRKVWDMRYIIKYLKNIFGTKPAFLAD